MPALSDTCAASGKAHKTALTGVVHVVGSTDRQSRRRYDESLDTEADRSRGADTESSSLHAHPTSLVGRSGAGETLVDPGAHGKIEVATTCFRCRQEETGGWSPQNETLEKEPRVPPSLFLASPE
jgi:hypothetical protein